MPIDHFDNTTSETFRNRYWINATYYVPGGPVFRQWCSSRSFEIGSRSIYAVFDSGEQNAEPLLPYYLQVKLQTA